MRLAPACRLVVVLACVVGAQSAFPATPVLQRVATGVERPTFVTTPPNDSSRLFVLEQYTGLIHIIVDGQKLTPPFLDLSAVAMDTGTEQGLCGLVFHPDFAENGRFFVNYINKEGDTVLARYTVSANPNLADTNSATVLFTIAQPRPEHNGGMMAFGPLDGYLYISSGDGGLDTFTVNNSLNARDLSNPLGKLLRIDVDATEPYAIPAENPFVADGTKDGRIWAYGLRNPWRFSFDRLTGDLFLGDVGNLSREEVDFIPAGTVVAKDFGWPSAEGAGCFGGFPGPCHTNAGRTPPIYDYDHFVDTKGEAAVARAVVGGYVYRGTLVPQFQGLYFFADFAQADLWTLRYENNLVTELTDRRDELTPLDGQPIETISSFGEDADGELYICSYEGDEVFKLVTLQQVADVNRNGAADSVDVQLVLNGVLGVGSGNPHIDANEDGTVNASDLQLVINGVLGL